MTGRSPIDYLNCYRVDRASEMLTETEKSIIDIAAECGFYDLSYFIKVFKKYKGPPGAVQKTFMNVNFTKNVCFFLEKIIFFEKFTKI